MYQNQQASNFQRKPSQLEETLQNFIKATHSGFEQANKNHETMSRNHDASIKKLEKQIGQLIDKNSLWRITDKQTLNGPNPPLPDYIKALNPIIKQKPLHEDEA